MQSSFRIAAIGELLWDLFPAGSQLGGAPANFAAMAAGLGDEALLISRLGEDALGKQARQQLAVRSVICDYLSNDPAHPTGTVSVALNGEGIPSYIIDENAAWDYLPWNPEIAGLAPTLDAVCFGTLAQRADPSRTTLRRLVQATRVDCMRVFDVNLRPPFWTSEQIVWGCSHASIVKMNYEEAPLVAEAIHASRAIHEAITVARHLLDRFAIKVVAITRGHNGSLLVTRDEVNDHPGIPSPVVDTVGAGDAFTAALVHYALRGTSLTIVAEAANRWGAWVATQYGGMPLVEPDVRSRMQGLIEQVSRTD